MIAALYVETNGAYFGLPHVDPWDRHRDARTYAGPHRIVAHPPCERWGRFWHGSTRKPHQYKYLLILKRIAATADAARLSYEDNELRPTLERIRDMARDAAQPSTVREG